MAADHNVVAVAADATLRSQHLGPRPGNTRMKSSSDLREEVGNQIGLFRDVFS